MARVSEHHVVQVADPPIARFVFADTRMAWLWLIVRLYLGYSWITSGFEKLNNPAWVRTGSALKGFWTSAIATEPKPVVTFDWYRSFLQLLLDTGAYTWFAKVVVAGELIVGICLVLGAFTGLAAFIGGFMNWNYMMAGTASVNPVFFTLSVLLIVAWKTAGFWGLDRWLLPALGTPWKPGFVLREQGATGSKAVSD